MSGLVAARSVFLSPPPCRARLRLHAQTVRQARRSAARNPLRGQGNDGMTAGLAASKRLSKGLTFAALTYTKRSAELRAARNAPQSDVTKG